MNENNGKLQLPEWLDTIAVFDTETTGLDLRNDRIVTASIQRLDVAGNLMPGGKDWVVNPGIPIPEKASQVHGFYDSDVVGAQSAAEAIAEILVTLKDCFAADIPVIAYNASYDFTILHYEALRYGLQPLEFGFVIDPLVIDKTIDKFRKGKRSLVAAAERYGVNLANAHTAKDDAIAAGHVGLGMLRFWFAQDKPAVAFPTDLDDLHNHQIKWANEIEASYAKWRQIEVPTYRPLYGWPVKEMD